MTRPVQPGSFIQTEVGGLIPLRVRRRPAIAFLALLSTVVLWMIAFGLVAFAVFIFVALAVGGGVIAWQTIALALLAIPTRVCIAAFGLKIQASVPVIECLACGWRAEMTPTK